MRNPEKWRPGRLVLNERSGEFEVDRKAVYTGSHYIADLQTHAYVPLIREHITGHVLDCGCGPVPYHQLYRDGITNSTCIDSSTEPRILDLLDAVVDLNGPLPYPDDTFDSALLSDVLAHIREPFQLMRELARVLKPGGKLVLTTPFNYWLCEYPNEYYRPTRFALQDLCEHNGLDVIILEPYGGQADVFLDTLNKILFKGNSYRLFRVLRWLAERSGWPARNRARTQETYALGYCLVARKR